MCIRDKQSRRLHNIIGQYSDTVDCDFNLTEMIVDFKERQREKVLQKFRDGLRKAFTGGNNNKKNEKTKGAAKKRKIPT